jgi:hypothetical protein
MTMNFLQKGTNEDPVLDKAARLIQAFRARPTPSVLAKRDILLQLGRLDHPGIVPFLLDVVADPAEPNKVRIDALKRLVDRPRLASYHQPVAEAIMQVLRESASLDLRLQVTLALAELTQVDGVLATLGGLALDPAETIDVRYTAFTSLERGGPTPECVALLRQLTADETFGHAARSLLARWKLG